MIPDELDIPELKKKLQDIMWDNVGIFRNEKTLTNAIEQIKELQAEFSREYKCQSKEEYEFKNMLTVSLLIAYCALRRKESRGAHYRTDYPETQEKLYIAL